MAHQTVWYSRPVLRAMSDKGMLQAAAQGKHIALTKGLDAENLAKVGKALEKGLSMAETVELAGISLSSVKRYCKHSQAVLR